MAARSDAQRAGAPRYYAPVLTPDVRFEGWTPTDWSRFLSVWKVAAVPAVDTAASDEAPRGGLVLVHDGGRVRKALHTIDGRVDPLTITWPRALSELAQEHRASWVWAFHVGALEEVMERFGARVRRGDDALTQALVFFGAFRELLAEGAVASWPRRLESIPIPTRAMVDRAVDALVPPGRAALLALYEEGELWTAAVLRRAMGAPARFDLLAGPMQLRREIGLVSGEFRRDYRHLVEAVEAIYAPVAVSLHADVAGFRRLITRAEPGDWARAVALRDVVLSPIPQVLALPLGVDATRGAVHFATKMASQVDPIGIVQPLLQWFSHLLPELPAVGGRAAPGFDPLEVLRKLLARGDDASRVERAERSERVDRV